MVGQSEVYNVYFEVGGPNPYLFAPQQGVSGDLLLWAPDNFVPSRQSIESLVSQRGESLDFAGLGAVEVIVADCVGGWADAGPQPREITVEASSGNKPYYFVDPQSPAGGQATILNVSPVPLSLTVRRGTTVIANARVPVRAGMFTLVTFNYPQWM